MDSSQSNTDVSTTSANASANVGVMASASEFLDENVYKRRLLSQGAEARIYEITKQDENGEQKKLILKERFQKLYRHPALETKIQRHRTTQEAKSIEKAKKMGIDVPNLIKADKKTNCIVMEHIPGRTVKDLLFDDNVPEDEKKELTGLMGVMIAKLHISDIVHGDLTTSNFMVRDDMITSASASASSSSLSSGKRSLVIIDFGLSSVSHKLEDKAVDLYVLERAFLSTHPESEVLFATVLDKYLETNKASGKQVIDHFEKVRQRGRKRVAFG